MNEWVEETQDRRDEGRCRERWVLVVDYRPNGNPAAWASAMRIVWDWDGESITLWEMRLMIPLDKTTQRPFSKPWQYGESEYDGMARSGMSMVKVGGPDRRAECLGKTRAELVRMFAEWGAA